MCPLFVSSENAECSFSEVAIKMVLDISSSLGTAMRPIRSYKCERKMCANTINSMCMCVFVNEWAVAMCQIKTMLKDATKGARYKTDPKSKHLLKRRKSRNCVCVCFFLFYFVFWTMTRTASVMMANCAFFMQITSNSSTAIHKSNNKWI